MTTTTIMVQDGKTNTTLLDSENFPKQHATATRFEKGLDLSIGGPYDGIGRHARLKI